MSAFLARKLLILESMKLAVTDLDSWRDDSLQITPDPLYKIKIKK